VDIQVLMGAALYLLFSPLTTVVLSSTGTELPPGSQAHYFGVVHPIMMLTALIVVHLGSAMIGRARNDVTRQRRAVIFYGFALLIVISGIPWWRPWLRF
jgi:hypothetical protein